jgi:hypothetical protein
MDILIYKIERRHARIFTFPNCVLKINEIFQMLRQLASETSKVVRLKSFRATNFQVFISFLIQSHIWKYYHGQMKQITDICE